MELPLGGFPSIGKVPTLPSVNDGANWLADTATAVADRLGLPHNRLFDEWASTLDPSRWPEPPEGDGRPAMLIPGFLAGDPSLSNMARWLKRGDWNMTRSGINWNVNCTQATIEGVEARLRASVEASGKRALLVGQSRGGAMGKVIAVRNPDLVETLVTLGSPLNDHFNIHPRTWFGIGIIGGLGELGFPGFLSRDCATGTAARKPGSPTAGRSPRMSASSPFTRAPTPSCVTRPVSIRPPSTSRSRAATSGWASTRKSGSA